VRAEQSELRSRSPLQGAQSGLILTAKGVVVRHDALEDLEADRTARGIVHFVPVEVRIAAVHEMSVSIAHGDCDVPACVSAHGDQQDLRLAHAQRSHRFEAFEVLSAESMLDEVR
jgi:hypothetical protein